MQGGIEDNFVFIGVDSGVFGKLSCMLVVGIHFKDIDQRGIENNILVGQRLIDKRTDKDHDDYGDNHIPFVVIEEISKFLFWSSVLQRFPLFSEFIHYRHGMSTFPRLPLIATLTFYLNQIISLPARIVNASILTRF